MSIWVLTQILVNLLFAAFLFVLWVRMQKEPQEDPRLSKGLQVLQTKISILEDLSDRTDKQVKDLCAIIERKSREVERSIVKADEQIAKINQSMQKSLEVADIFQDKIPHDEIIERKKNQKYIDAAILAHRGMSVEEISSKVDLSIAEIEFITKVNKDRLMFSEENLPSWAKKKTDRDYSEVFSQNHYDELKNLGEKFRSASIENIEDNKSSLKQTVKSDNIRKIDLTDPNDKSDILLNNLS